MNCQGRGNVPKRVFLFSGKRKCGKDFITDILVERLGDKAVIVKISAPIKSHWAKEKGLNLDDLMSANEYKEKFRHEMVVWSEAVRDKDPGYFCRKAVTMNNAQDKPIWIVSDIRRRSDIAWFRQEYGNAIRTIRVTTDDEVRSKRGFKFTPGVDDKPTECDLDEVTDWDWTITNNGDEEQLENSILCLVKDVECISNC
ncbi:phosphomevalonate kinase [Thrips palmi]|uniref:Phosphomevalonate kinase n=1 Tax=Thrips palmi TaxID=161013 RepID=A0A6P8ZMS3_THRPL|nr:phosphomevalonate kinase [Thrips palmi]